MRWRSGIRFILSLLRWSVVVESKSIIPALLLRETELPFTSRRAVSRSGSTMKVSPPSSAIRRKRQHNRPARQIGAAGKSCGLIRFPGTASATERFCDRAVSVKKYSIKPGRGPSALGAVGGILGVCFGILWTILAIWITADAPFPEVKIIFPLFGVIFIVAAIVGIFYNAHNATQENRFSNLDIVPAESEPEPLFSKQGKQSEAQLEKFCTHCGTNIRREDKFCSNCGGQAST